MSLVGTTLLGYVYNRAPVYMQVSSDDGSMLDERKRRFWQPAGRT
jgi:hypothetical protein